jgi:hypothetical protein
MGMTLIPIRPTQKAPLDKNGNPRWLHYNLGDWGWLRQQLRGWGVDTARFSSCNDGERIPAKLCRQVADALEVHLGELDGEQR